MYVGASGKLMAGERKEKIGQKRHIYTSRKEDVNLKDIHIL